MKVVQCPTNRLFKELFFIEQTGTLAEQDCLEIILIVTELNGQNTSIRIMGFYGKML